MWYSGMHHNNAGLPVPLLLYPPKWLSPWVCKITESEALTQTCAFVVSSSKAQEPLFRNSSDYCMIWQVPEQNSTTMTMLLNCEADEKKMCLPTAGGVMPEPCPHPKLTHEPVLQSPPFLPQLQTSPDCPPCHWLSSDGATALALQKHTWNESLKEGSLGLKIPEGSVHRAIDSTMSVSMVKENIMVHNLLTSQPSSGKGQGANVSTFHEYAIEPHR